MKYFELLGYKCRDIVTGFEGVAESISFDLYGCIQVVLVPSIPKDSKTKEYPSGRWFDAKRLKKVNQKLVMPVPDFSEPEVGPADKPSRSNEYIRQRAAPAAERETMKELFQSMRQFGKKIMLMPNEYANGRIRDITVVAEGDEAERLLRAATAIRDGADPVPAD